MKIIKIKTCKDCPYKEFIDGLSGNFIRCTKSDFDVTKYYFTSTHPKCQLEDMVTKTH